MPSYLNGKFAEKFMLIVFPTNLCIFDLLHLDTVSDLSVCSACFFLFFYQFDQ